MASHLVKCLIGEARRNAGPSSDEMAMRLFVRKSLEPLLKLTFLRDQKETIYITLKWEKNGYMRGGSVIPGLAPRPTDAQLRQIGGPIGGASGGSYAMERIYSARYEGNETSGTLVYDDAEDERDTTEHTRGMYIRPLAWEIMNEGDPPEEMYAQQ